MRSTVLVLSLVVLSAATSAPAGIIGISGGTGAPGTTLGPYPMTAFPLDANPLGAVTSVASPLGGQVDFSLSMDHMLIGPYPGWATWSNGYTGDVYWTGGPPSVTMTLPADTTAFYFYAEPQPVGTYTIAATAQDGTQVIQNVNWNGGAAYYGFYGTGGSFVQQITVTTGNHGADFAVGEFGIARVPAPAGIFLASLGSVLVGHLRRRRTL